MYHEARNDKKLAVLNDAQHRVWFNLLCLAAEQSPRGEIPHMAEYILALEVANGRVEVLRETLDLLANLDILNFADDGSSMWFIHFEDRNHDKPSDLPDQVNARVKRHRENKRNAIQNDVSPLKRDVTPSNAQEEKRVEEIRGEENGSLSFASANAPKTKRATPLPDDFTVTDEMINWALAEEFTFAMIDGETALFRDHFLGNGKPMKDWPATWRNWMRRSRAFARGSPNGRASPSEFGPKGPDAQYFADKARELERQGL